MASAFMLKIQTTAQQKISRPEIKKHISTITDNKFSNLLENNPNGNV